MSQLVNYSIIEAGLRALADKAHESAVAQAEGKPIPCGISHHSHLFDIPSAVHQPAGLQLQ